jgi:CRISPR system Cascade subunit CasE
MFFSKIMVREDASGSGKFWSAFRSAYSLHQAIWELFGDRADRERDFLYHVKEAGGPPVIYALSMRLPVDHNGMWDLETKKFDPKLNAGMHLGFLLRANPVRTREGKRHDVVMEEKHKLKIQKMPRADWPLEAELVQDAGAKWLDARVEKAGFRIHNVRADGYRQHQFFKSGAGRPVCISTIDFTGVLEVTEPACFRDALSGGFGPAKGFGCGMMLVRRME